MRGLVGGARVGRLGTVSGEGQPHLVPICFAVVGEIVYHAVDHKPKRSHDLRRIANIRATHRVSLLVDEYHDADWSRLWWVRLDGTARLVTDEPERGQALDALAARYAQYRTTRPAGPVIAIDVDRWSGWSANGC